MLFEIARVLKPDGILIMSSPDKKYYSDITGFKNKFHVKELYFEEFKELIKRHFKSSNFYFQKSYNLNSYIYGVNCVETVVYSGSFNEVYKHELEPLYNIVIASQCFTDEMKPSIFDGSSITDLLIRARIKSNTEHIKQTTSYRIGNFLCFPFFCLKKIIKNG